MVKDGIPYVIIPLGIALILGFFQIWIVAAFFLAIAGFMAFFFRNPHRRVPEGTGLILSAADGRVTRVEDRGETKLISVFLSPFDVHINRSPIAGTITDVTYVAGKKNPATSDNSSLVNERNSLTIKGEDFAVVCTQIAGILARRIVCWKNAGDSVEMGERFGLIKFSSRTDLLIPGRAEVLVQTGDRVKGGETVIAKVA
jgi:phosphatidylserine decarboxylase